MQGLPLSPTPQATCKMTPTQGGFRSDPKPSTHSELDRASWARMLGACRGRSCPGWPLPRRGEGRILGAGLSYPWGSSSLTMELAFVRGGAIPVAQLGTQKYLMSLCCFTFNKQLVTDIQRSVVFRILRTGSLGPIPSPPSGIPERILPPLVKETHLLFWFVIWTQRKGGVYSCL